jgi:ferritin-like metal-binding protein YciE
MNTITDPATAAQQRLVVRQLQTIHTMKAAALKMFDPMLAAVEAERRNPDMAQVVDLLGNMLGAFGEHRDQTAAHERALLRRLQELDRRPLGVVRRRGAALGATARARLGAIGGQDHGANARDAFVYEHLEIALLELLERAARRAGDDETARIAGECLADDQAMAEKIARNWENVLSLGLASRGIPFERPA